VSEWVVLLHVAVSFWFVAGVLGRSVTMARARSANDLSTLVELVDLSGRFERLMVIPGSFGVLIAGLLAAWAEGQPLAGTDDWWLLTSLILFVGLGVLVPTVFLPRGKVFEGCARGREAARRGDARAAHRAPRSGRPQRASRRDRRGGDHRGADGHETVLMPSVSADRRARPSR
jgi:hypothetical protein